MIRLAARHGPTAGRADASLAIPAAVMTYTPFIIVGMPRTGSNLLFTTLRQHRAIAAYSELFHPMLGERSGRHAIRRDGAALYYGGDADPVDFLRRWVWTGGAGDYRAIGFKIFAEYLRCKPTGRLLERLTEEVPGLHVVHIRRANYFDVFVSRLVATKTGSWISYREDTPSGDALGKMHLAIREEAATRFFRAMEWADAYIESLFRGCAYLRVDYERLAQDVQGQATAVFDYLGVGKCPVEMATRKQLTVRKEDLVANYHELRRHYSGTAYEAFFASDSDTPTSAVAARREGHVNVAVNDQSANGNASSRSLEWLDEAISTAVNGGLIPGQPAGSAANGHVFRRAETDVLATLPRSTAARGNLEAVNGAAVAPRTDLTLPAGAAISLRGWCCRAEGVEMVGDQRYFFLEGRNPAVRYYAQVESRIRRDDVAAAVKLADSITRFNGFDFVADFRQVAPGRYRLGVAHEAGGVRYEFLFKHRLTIAS
ncbi:MAG TPA: sulfotransferase [Casimicrobiaceae bacterium]|nr:sulfotransferase [Casimicrobiaceae bacterium]